MTQPLQRAVEVMDTLRSPGGCPWDAEQTHASLVRYLVEECYELIQAIEDADPQAICEELGDVLLQVLFHARIAAEAEPGFDIDDVATVLVNKLIRRHPHVFDPASPVVRTASDQQRRWDELKVAEGKTDALDGVSLAAPALALAGKLGARAAKYDAHAPLPAGEGAAEEIFRIAYAAGLSGADIEGQVRAVAKAHAAAMADSS